MRRGGVQCLGWPGALRAGLLYDWNADHCPNVAGVVVGNWVDDRSGIAATATTGTVFVPGAVQGHASVRFNGSSQTVQTTPTIVKALPYHIWTVHKVITWTNNNVLAAFTGGSDAQAIGCNGTTPGLGMYAGTSWSGSDTHLAVGTWGIMKWIVNGASSTVTNYSASSVGSPTNCGSAGINDANGKFYMGGWNGGSFLNCEISRVLIYDPSVTGYNESLEGQDLVNTYLI